jgi:Complex I intermediate-associated protein 30 (CIA30)
MPKNMAIIYKNNLFLFVVVLSIVAVVNYDGFLLPLFDTLVVPNEVGSVAAATEQRQLRLSLVVPPVDFAVFPRTTTQIDSSNRILPQNRIVLESFEHPMHGWKVLNDPVMGGKSVGNFTIVNGIGILVGQVNNIPFLHVPGFLQVQSHVSHVSPSSNDHSDNPNVNTTPKDVFPDISSCTAMELWIRSQSPYYTGYRMSFGTQHAPHGKRFAYGYKAHFMVPPPPSSVSVSSVSHPHTNTEEQDEDDDDKEDLPAAWHSITIPFEEFTDDWDDATGDPIHSCNATAGSENAVYCPNVATLHR